MATPRSRPTTPLRPPSRTSLRASQSTPLSSSSTTHPNPLTVLEPQFAELSDSMADLESNFMHLQLLHESISRFNENFGAFLYGLNMSAFCVDFPEAPIPQSFARAFSLQPTSPGPFRDTRTKNLDGTAAADVDATFLTTDTTFVENPPASSRVGNRYSSVPSSVLGRGGAPSAAQRTRGASRGRGERGGIGGSRGRGRGVVR